MDGETDSFLGRGLFNLTSVMKKMLAKWEL